MEPARNPEKVFSHLFAIYRICMALGMNPFISLDLESERVSKYSMIADSLLDNPEWFGRHLQADVLLIN
jgi:hypothetical protein